MWPSGSHCGLTQQVLRKVFQNKCSPVVSLKYVGEVRWGEVRTQSQVSHCDHPLAMWHAALRFFRPLALSNVFFQHIYAIPGLWALGQLPGETAEVRGHLTIQAGEG